MIAEVDSRVKKCAENFGGFWRARLEDSDLKELRK